MTQLESARRGIVTPEMRRVAERERTTADLIRDEVARGRLVIPANVHHLAGSSGERPAARPNGQAAAAPGSLADQRTTAPAIRGRRRRRRTGSIRP
jgi:hypothetical protein